MTESADPITALRDAIDALPVHAREAMLEGIRSNPIIVGAYTDNRGGICPMLAAHRNGGRVTYLPFARSWDRFARATKTRRASGRELRILEAQLVSSLFAEEKIDLEGAISEHLALKQIHEAAERERESAQEIQARRLTQNRIRLLRPSRADSERALELFNAELAKL